ncbi:MAG: hypothetical protein RLZZ303_2703 [Candidatus Hydrogenedentota bacterium]
MSRSKRRERREGRFTLPLTAMLFLCFALFIAIAFSGLLAIATWGESRALERRAELPLAHRLESNEAVLRAELQPALEIARAAADLLRSQPNLARDAAGLRQQFLPLLRHQPGVTLLRVRHEQGRLWEIMRDADTWLTRRTVEGDPGLNTVWERWDAPGTTRLSEQADEAVALPPAPGSTAKPAEFRFSPPARLGRASALSLPLSIDLEDDGGRFELTVGASLAGVLEHLSTDPLNTLVALPDGALVAPEPLEDNHPLRAGLGRMLNDTYPPDAPYTSAHTEQPWWFSSSRISLGKELHLISLAGIPKAELLADAREFGKILTAGAAVSLLVALFAAWWMARSIARPLRDFMRRARRIDIMERALGHRPHSRLREVDQLYETLDEVYAGVADELSSREMPLVLPAHTVRKTGGEAGEALLIGQETESAPALATPDAMEVPEAYMQAIQSTRRKLRRLTMELEAQREAARQLEDGRERDAERWERARAAATEISSALALDGQDFDLFARHATRLTVTAVEAARCTLWIACDGFERLTLAHRDDRFESDAAGMQELRRADHPLLFSSLDTLPCLSARDAGMDPRTASYVAAMPWRPQAASLLACPIRLREGVVAVLLLERAAPPQAWPASSESLACLAAAALGASWELAQRPRPESPPAMDDDELDEHEEAMESPLYRHLVDSTQGALYAVDRAGRITFANATAERIYQRPAHDWLGLPMAHLAASRYDAVDQRALSSILDGDEAVTIDSEHLRADGRSMPMRLLWSPLEDEDGDIIGAVVMATRSEFDIDAALKRESRYREYLENLGGVFFSLDHEGIINYASPAAERVYGYAPAELTGRSIAMLADAEQALLDRTALDALLNGGACTGYDTLHRTRAGEPVALTIHASLRRGSGESPDAITGVAYPRAAQATQE